MKILHLVDNLFTYSGIARYLLIVSSKYPKNNIVVSIDSDNIKEKFAAYGIKTYSNRLLSFPIFTIFFLIYFCRKNRIELIHTHHRYFDGIMWIVNIFVRKKTVCSVHSIVTGKKYFSYKSHHLIAVSNAVKYHLIKHFKIDPERVIKHYNAIDPQLIKPDLTRKQLLKKYSLAENNFKIGFFGKLSQEEKGIDILLNAIKAIEDYHSSINYQLIIIGDGKDRDWLNKFIQINSINAKVIESQTEISNFYQILDCYILPSNVDPFPYAMLECAYFKVPFIGSDVDGISEFIENNYTGLLFKKGNTKELVEKVLFIYNNPTVAQNLAENNYHKVTTKFLFDTKNKIYEIYEKVLLQ